MTIPYTYRVFCKITNQYYYGVRFAKGCKPEDLFVKYFTSSKNVKRLIELYGRDQFIIEIRKVFENKEKAINWEKRVNRWTMRWPNYLNKHSNGNFILTDEERRQIGIMSGNKCRDLKLGFHSMSRNDRIFASKKGAETTKLNNTGIYSIPHNTKIEIGNKCRDLKIGFHSDESRKKVSNRMKQPWWNNGISDKKSDICPGDTWVLGRLTKGRKWWNNGTTEIMSTIPPDNTWIMGRLK